MGVGLDHVQIAITVDVGKTHGGGAPVVTIVRIVFQLCGDRVVVNAIALVE